HARTGSLRAEAQPGLVAQQQAFDRLRDEFLAGTRMLAPFLESTLVKLANSFETPPASEWAGFQVGGCIERSLFLSRLNDLQEIFQIRGSATDWFCEVAERAGNALPAWVPDHPILFDNFRRNVFGIPSG